MTLLQQRFIADGTGRDDADNFALNRTFAGGRVANLFANGNRLPLIHQFCEVVFYRVVGNARHRDRFARGCAALGQRDIQQLRRTFGIVIKQFVKVAHAVKQQDLRVLSLQLKILLHHGGVVGEVRIK